MHLVAGVGARRTADLFKHHGQQRDRDLLTGGEQHVHLACRRLGIDTLGELDEAVGLAAHGRDDDDDIVALVTETLYTLGNRLDTLRAADRGAAVLLDDQCHRAGFQKKREFNPLFSRE